MYGQESAKRQIAELAKGGGVRETEALSCAVRRQPEEKSFLFDNPVDIYIYIYRSWVEELSSPVCIMLD